uniref:Uncharacterized protein n=1 Tax=Anguilla anguilla TaxID=7936 RepID=A0A0E9PU48_ANGAN
MMPVMKSVSGIARVSQRTSCLSTSVTTHHISKPNFPEATASIATTNFFLTSSTFSRSDNA